MAISSEIETLKKFDQYIIFLRKSKSFVYKKSFHKFGGRRDCPTGLAQYLEEW